MSEENVKVAVRVRPFNQREKDAKSKLIVAMAGNQTIVTNPDTGEEKKFAYDYSYWSHDGYKREANGYYSPANSKYCDQKKVYNDLGQGVLKNAWEGFNASLFAYGQTGSGKSYSVVGYPENSGIVPMICEEIFKTKATKTDKTIEVTFSMLEIYSEVVRDLLNPAGDKKTGLKIREDPKNGFYPVGLTKTMVGSYEDITRLMEVGTASRTIAATNMNATSSRAHTIVTISLVQKYKNEVGKEMAKSSLMNLVDLAGSERADATGATGDRLKEGAAINLSLTSLGNVISALADNSSGKNARVPYRDSSLTKLLANALGGNSKTIMIAAISPADINYDETLSTLRYADRAKQIKCKAIVNEDPTEKLIADLKAENERLKKLVESGGKSSDGNQLSDEEMRKELEENEREMLLMKQSYEEKLAAAKALVNNSSNEMQIIKEKAKKIPHLTNVNMDPSLSGSHKLILEGDGAKKLAPPGKGDIPLNGLGILTPHAIITVKGNKYTIEKCPDAKVLLNGKHLHNPTDLQHRDRLLFGASQYFMFIDPSKAKPTDEFVTFEMMQNEIAQEAGIISSENNSRMSKDEIVCQSEMIDLLPSIDEANAMSIDLDKKVKFTAFPVSGASRGEFNGKLKAYVSVKNFTTDLEWIWTKEKFLDRKQDMAEYYNDFKDNKKVDNKKFKKYDPFYESPDTPTQIGTATINPKEFALMLETKNSYDIYDLRNNLAGKVLIELLPCNSQGQPIKAKDAIKIINPEKDLLGKELNFLFNINKAEIINEVYEDIFCQYSIFDDKKVYKTEVVRGTNKPEFKYSNKLTFTATPEFLKMLSSKTIYVQVWGEQKHPKPSKNTGTTKDFFSRELENLTSTVVGRITKSVDPEKAKLKEDVEISKLKEKRYDFTMSNINYLIHRAGKAPISSETLKSIVQAKSNDEVEAILKQYPDNGPRPQSAASSVDIDENDSDGKTKKKGKAKSQACLIS